MKIFWGCVFIIAIYLSYNAYQDAVPFWNNDHAGMLNVLWKDDVKLLVKAQKLPKAWGEIRNIHVDTASPIAAKWMKNIEVPIKVRHDGGYRLDILIDHWIYQGHLGAMIQYNLVDLKSGNTVWELGRTLTIGKHAEKSVAVLKKKAKASRTQIKTIPKKRARTIPKKIKKKPRKPKPRANPRRRTAPRRKQKKKDQDGVLWQEI
jgi:hypothetical protein